MIELDSSSIKKFSRHLIITSKHLIFKNNFHVGKFVKLIIEKMNCDQSLFDLCSVFINQDRLEKKIFIDEGK